MKYLFTIALLFIGTHLFGQVKSSMDSIEVSMDTTRMNNAERGDSISAGSSNKNKKNKKQKRSWKERRQQKDSAQSQLRSKQTGFIKPVDSVKQSITGLPNAYLDSVRNKMGNLRDKSGLTELSEKVNHPVSAIPQSHKLDSLKGAGNQQLDKIQEPQRKLTGAQSKVNELQSKPVSEVNGKLSQLSQESGGKAVLPENVKSVSPSTGMIPDANPVSGQLNVDTSLPQLNTPSSNVPSMDLDLNSKMKLPDLPKTDITSNLENLKQGSDKISSVSSQAGAYAEEVQKVKEGGNLADASAIQQQAISRLPVKDELQTLQSQEAVLKSTQEQLQSFKNPDAYKKQTLARAKEKIFQQMTMNQGPLEASIKKLSDYERKGNSILSRKKDLPKKRDALHKLKPHEHYVPGITLQLQKPGGWLIDVNPSLRYRITAYWSVGLGWNERIPLSSTLKNSRIFGPRSFTEVIIFKGFAMRFDAESMHTYQAAGQSSSQDAAITRWTYNYLAGIKKEFSFVPHVIGNAQFMYNVFSSNKPGSYPAKFNVRLGFEFPRTKKKTSNFEKAKLKN